MVSLHLSPCNINNSVTLVKVTHDDRTTDRKCCVLEADELKCGEWRQLHTQLAHYERVWWAETRIPDRQFPSRQHKTCCTWTDNYGKERHEYCIFSVKEPNCMCLLFFCFLKNRSVYLHYKSKCCSYMRCDYLQILWSGTLGKEKSVKFPSHSWKSQQNVLTYLHCSCSYIRHKSINNKKKGGGIQDLELWSSTSKWLLFVSLNYSAGSDFLTAITNPRLNWKIWLCVELLKCTWNGVPN